MKPNKEYSKRLGVFFMCVAVSQLITGLVLSLLEKDTTLCFYSIPSTWGCLGVWSAYYTNKAKIENITKGREKLALKIMFIKKKFTSAEYQELIDEFDKIDNAYINKLDNDLETATSQEMQEPYL